MRIQRYFTSKNQPIYEGIDFTHIPHVHGSFHVPASWSNNAALAFMQTFASTAFIPKNLICNDEPGVPAWLQPKKAEPSVQVNEVSGQSHETDAQQVFNRMAGTWTYWGWKNNYFNHAEDARIFHDELCIMLATQKAIPHGPLCNNASLKWAYGISTPSPVNQSSSTPLDSPKFTFLNEDPCASASLNLLAFYTKGQFDLKAYTHAIRLWTMVLDISIAMNQNTITATHSVFRPLGLGYVNLGATLLAMGLTPSSDGAKATAGALTAILTGVAYGTSAEMAKKVGMFQNYDANQDLLLQKINEYRQAAYGKAINNRLMYVLPESLDPKLDAYTPLLQSAKNAWDEALAMGKKNGYRNAQTTALMFSKETACMLDADVQGIEAPSLLVLFKKDNEGGVVKSLHPAFLHALETLKYSKTAIHAITTHIIGHGTLKGAPTMSMDVLKDKGFTPDMLTRLAKTLPKALHIRFAFNKSVIASDACIKALGLSDALENPKLNILEKLGFTPDAIHAANAYCCGTLSLRGAPHLLPEHKAIFDSFMDTGSSAQNTLLQAIKTFISGSVTQTLNFPRSGITIDLEKIYDLSWAQGLKCNTLFEKAIALNNNDNTVVVPQEAFATPEAEPKPAQEHVQDTAPVFETIALHERRKLPARRKGYTQKAVVGGHKVYLRTGEYADGKLGEIFIDMHKEGAAFRSMMNSFAMAISIGLQYGVPLDEFVEAFSFTRFEPWGVVKGNEAIKSATSILDYIFRELAISYSGRTDLAHANPSELISSTIGDAERDYAMHQSAFTLASTGFIRGHLLSGINNDPETFSTRQGVLDLENHDDTKPQTSFLKEDMRQEAAELKSKIVQQERQKNYENNACDACGNFTIIADETSVKCVSCGHMPESM